MPGNDPTRMITREPIRQSNESTHEATQELDPCLAEAVACTNMGSNNAPRPYVMIPSPGKRTIDSPALSSNNALRDAVYGENLATRRNLGLGSIGLRGCDKNLSSRGAAHQSRADHIHHVGFW